MVFYQDKALNIDSNNVILSGGYSGHANFGDILQLKSVISWYKNRKYNPIVIIRLDAIYDGTFIDYIYKSFGVSSFIFYSTTVFDVSKYNLKVLEKFTCDIFHLYGGGMINTLWAKDIITLNEAIINKFSIKKYLISGQQIDAFGAKLLKSHFSKFPASIVGVRDYASMQYLQENNIKSQYSFDDAYEELSRLKEYFLLRKFKNKQIYLHLNLSPYVADDLLLYIEKFKNEFLLVKNKYPNAEYKLLLTYQDSRILSIVETPSAISTLDYHFDMDEFTVINLASIAQKKEPSKIHDIDRDGIALVTSYHTAMFMQSLGLNVYMFANNDYYKQKQKGLGLAFPSVSEMINRSQSTVELEIKRVESRESWLKVLTLALNSDEYISSQSFNDVYPRPTVVFKHKAIQSNLELTIKNMGFKKTDTEKVFGIGWAKTGTTTLGKVFEALGYKHKTQDFTLLDDFMQGSYKNLNQVIKEYDSFEDWPWLVMFKQLDALYPNSKFILTIRDPKDWISSFRNMLKNEKSSDYTNKSRSFLYGLSFPNVSDEKLLYRYNYHIAEVKNYFRYRTNDLLIVDWSKGDDWEKICDFLNKKIPNKPFPHANKGKYN